MSEDLRQVAGPLYKTMLRSGMAMVVTNPRLPDNPIVFVNDAFLRLTGYREDEVVGRNCRFLQTSATDRQTVERIRLALQQGNEIEVEILNARKDGSTFWNKLFIGPVPDDASEHPRFFFSTQFDTTPSRRAGDLAVEVASKEKQLAAIGSRLQATLTNSGAAAAWEWHIKRSIIFGDARFASLYGIDVAAAARGVDPSVFFSIVHPEDRGRIRLAVGAMLRGAEVLSKDYRILSNGSVRWVRARGQTSHDEDGSPESFTGILLDVTEQKTIEEQLRIAQSAGGVGTFSYVDGFATASVSNQFCKLLGLQPALRLPISTINKVAAAHDAPIIEAREPKTAGAVSGVDVRIIKPDTGELRWLTRRGEFVRDSETAGLRFVGVVFDVTEAKAREVQLREFNEDLERRVDERTRNLRLSEAKAGAYFNLSPENLLLVRVEADGTVRIEDLNPASERLYALQGSEVRGARLDAVFDAVTARELEQYARDTIESGDVRSYQVTRTFADGSREVTLDVSVALIERSDGGGGLSLFSGRDVTEQRRIEEELRQSQKMEAVGQLTGGVAHDFNNLLTGVTGNLDLLQTRIRQGRINDVDRYVASAQGAAQRAAALTHRLLAFSRRQTLEPKPTNVNRLVAGMQDLIQRTVGPAIAIESARITGLWNTLVDPGQLENALLNLCINARDAMPNGGTITIETANRWLDEQGARERELPPGQYVSLCVSDTGTGMADDVIARAFDPFFTTKPIGQGTGLGLSMIYGFARQSNGQVRIYSEVGAGTMVCLFLPRHQGEEDAVGPLADLSEAPRAINGETVLVIDDDSTVRMLVTEVLNDLGYTPIEAADGAAGLKVIQSNARIDLLVTDVGLPGGMNGRQVADAARVTRPDLKVLFVTGYAENAVLRNGHLDRDMHVMTKPFAMEAFANRIKSLIGSS